MLSFVKSVALLFSATVLMGCVSPSGASSNSSTETPQMIVADVEFEPLTHEIADRVKADLREEIGATVLSVERYSRETWSDGCLGLGGPAELCLAALTEGWQVEVVDLEGQSYFYRTDLTGQNIRRSTLDQNLPPSLRDLIFQAIADNGWADYEALSVAEAEPRFWDGCYGVPPKEGGCPEIAIFGWRAVVTDGSQSWIYHTDNGGVLVLVDR